MHYIEKITFSKYDWNFKSVNNTLQLEGEVNNHSNQVLHKHITISSINLIDKTFTFPTFWVDKAAFKILIVTQCVRSWHTCSDIVIVASLVILKSTNIYTNSKSSTWLRLILHNLPWIQVVWIWPIVIKYNNRKNV